MNPLDIASSPFRSGSATPSNLVNYTAGERETLDVRQTDITIVTKEGDVVTLSSRYGTQTSSSIAYWSQPGGSQQQASGSQPGSSTLQASWSTTTVEGYAMSVSGQLSEQELTDIKDILSDLKSVSSHFYAGDLDAAMEDALALGDLGSLAQVSASFVHASSQNTVVESHALPTMSAEALNQLKDLAEQANEERRQKAADMELKQSLWEEIKKVLEKNLEHAAGSSSMKTQPVSQRMERLQEILDNHPRLAPSIVNLFDRVLKRLGLSE